MSGSINQALLSAVEGHPISLGEMEGAIGQIMDGQASPTLIAAILTALKTKGETAEEIAGAAAAMRARATRVPVKTGGLIDTCGTGGDKLHTFNISTATAFVVAACGVPVAKHGNKSATSTSGSAEVLEALGVNLSLSPEQVGQCIDEIGIGFCYARLLHSAMKHVAPVRAELGFPTIFNFLGPLTNPAGAELQLIGTGRVVNAEKLAYAIQQLGTHRTLIVCGNNELDEVALWGATTAFEVHDGNVTRHAWTPEEFGLPSCDVNELTVSGPEESAETIRDLLSGHEGAALDIVLANAAAALWCAGKCLSIAEGVKLGRQAVEEGSAAEKLKQLSKLTQALSS